MSTNIQRGGLPFEKFFRRRSSSVERPKDPEKSVKTVEDDVENSAPEEKAQNKTPETKNAPPDDPSTPTKQIEDISIQKTNDSKKSQKKNKSPSTLQNTFSKADDKIDDSEPCKEFIIKDEVGQVKLTEIINNSIKEAVFNIVKEGVCPLADSLDLRVKDSSKKSPTSQVQETHDKENEPGSPKPLSSLPSGANKTFDSHLCQSQYQRLSQISPRTSRKLNDQQERINQSIHQVSPHINTIKKLIKCPKQKDKRVKEGSPKISHQTKGQSSHFKTDNRRMTGNVNIYICSEANENSKGKQKPKNLKSSNDDLESASETTPSSTLSLSTSKLVAALRKKQGKNLGNQSSSCVCEPLDNSVKPFTSYSKMGNGNDDDDGDDVLCLSDKDNDEVELPDTQSGSSRDFCLCETTKFSDLDFRGSDEGNFNKPFSSDVSSDFIEYGRDDDWVCNSEDCASCDINDDRRRFNAMTHDDNAKSDLDERRSCCNLGRSNQDRTIVVPCTRNGKVQPENRKSRERNLRKTRDGQKFDKCLCVVEEEDENCCNDRKRSEPKFTVCGMLSNDESMEKDHGNDQKQNDEPENSSSGSGSNLMKKENENIYFPKAEKKNSVRASTSNEKIINKEEEADVEDDSKPEAPKPTLLSTLKKNFKRSSGKKNEKAKNSTDTKKEEDQVKNIGTDKNGIGTDESITSGNKNASEVPNEKPKNSLFYRSIQKAMDIVKIHKDDKEDEKNKDYSSEFQTKPQNNEEKGTDDKINKNGNENFILNSGNNPKQEKRSKSRISTAIASRRNSATTSNESSNVSLSQNEANKNERPKNLSTIQSSTKPQDSEPGLSSCKCEKLSERSECRCKKPEPPKNDSCNCYNTPCKKSTSETRIRCKIFSPKKESKESFSCCPKCDNSADKCICCNRKSELIPSDPCKCCPRCKRQIPECKCFCPKPETADYELCDCCLRQKHLCSCNLEKKSCGNKLQVQKCGQPQDFQDNLHQCNNCCRPEAECRCFRMVSNWEFPKSMICIYCDKPKENCTCKAPVRKCSQCGLPLDVCNCKPVSCCNCNGREIFQGDENEAQTICVTAWKPRRSVRRYFEREVKDADDNSEEDCMCYEKNKPYGSERLPYQKGSVFSNVMNELQQKMSDSMCCNICRNVPCNCCTENEKVGRKPKQRLSPIPEKRGNYNSRNRSRSKSPIGSCKCSSPRKKSGRNVPVLKVCDRCRTSPCRCRRCSTSPRNKPPAKCYYCKNSPCICAAAQKPANICPFRKADSSHRRRKNYSSTEKNVNADVRNENNDQRGRGNSHILSYPGNQRLRKYCYRENPPEEQTLNSEERVR